MAVNYDREEFRKYLHDSGAVKALSNVLMKLYELKNNRPKAAIIFIHDHIFDELPSLTEYENLQAELKATTNILETLKNNGNLSNDQLAIINNIMSSKPGQSNVAALISARQSQIMRAKTSKKNLSKIRKIPDTEPNYIANMKKALTDLHSDTNCKSLLKKHLTEGIFDTLINLKTASGSTLIHCISSGLEIRESMVGVYAADEEAYDKFEELFNPLITDYHHPFNVQSDTHPQLDWGDPLSFTDLDPKKEFITSTRIRCVRTVQGYPLIPMMKEDEFLKLCAEIKVVLDALTGDVAGEWYGIDTVNDKTKRELIKNRYILEYGDRFLESAGATEFWPKGRAVYINKARTFFVWVNEEDHLRFISMNAGANIPLIYKQLIDAVVQCSKLTFTTHKRFGFLTLCPTNLGNTIRASVMIKLPKLITKRTELEKLAKTLNLELRGSHGNDIANSEMIEISNKRKLGLTEHDSIKELHDGILKIIEEERSLSNP